MAAKETVVLAFSGGLDTSYCVLDLIDQGYEVVTVFVDTGGADQQQSEWIRQRAVALGSASHYQLDASQDLWDEFVVPLVWSHARMRGEYPLLCSDRYLIVRHSLALADQLGSRHFGHGCTGMGNDQLRFDQTVRSLGDYTIHAPIRDLQRQVSAVREHEIKLLNERGFEIPESNSRYSINENVLGVTISGSEIDQFEAPSEDAWSLCKPAAEWPAKSLQVRIGFDRGRAVSLDGETLPGPEILRRLNRAFGAYGVGRHIYTGDVSIGLKGRIAFECPGVDVLLTAHQALEDTVNTRWQNEFRSQISERWGELVYRGFFYEPHKQDLEAYLASSQRYVSGSVSIVSQGGNAWAAAVESDYILQDKDAVYAQSSDWTPEEAEGFIKLLGRSSTLASKVRGPAGDD